MTDGRCRGDGDDLMGGEMDRDEFATAVEMS